MTHAEIGTGQPLAPRWRGNGAASPVSGVLLLLAGWELAGRLLTDAFVLAAPSEIALYLVGDWQLMTRALAVTLGNAAAGFVIGNLAALALAGVALVWPRSERVITGLALLVFCLPLVATGPILRVFFGRVLNERFSLPDCFAGSLQCLLFFRSQ